MYIANLTGDSMVMHGQRGGAAAWSLAPRRQLRPGAFDEGFSAGTRFRLSLALHPTRKPQQEYRSTDGSDVSARTVVQIRRRAAAGNGGMRNEVWAWRLPLRFQPPNPHYSTQFGNALVQ